MDKYEFNIKIEQIKKLVGKGDYETAMKIADTIDWRRVRNTNLLSMVATIYEKNEDYEEAKEILLLAYERAPIGKRLLYKLAELALKQGNIEEAEAYYKEFGDLASDDPRQQLLRYMILKAKGAPAQQLIHSLEAYTSVELDEKWLYELAELYSLAGMADRCVETCDRIMLMFGLGKYVDKAMELKIKYAPLTRYQMDLVENRDKYEAKLRAVEQEYSGNRVHMPENRPEPVYYENEPEPEQVQVQEQAAGYMQEPEYTETPYYDQSQDYVEAPGYGQAMGYEQSAEPGWEENTPQAFGNAGQETDPGAESLVGDHLEARMQEAAVQENLAREMSRISYQEAPIPQETQMEHTRVLDDIRRVGRPVTAIPRPKTVYQPPEEPVNVVSEPVVEEEILEPEESSLAQEYSAPEYPASDYGYQQAAITAEPLEDQTNQAPSAVYESSALKPSDPYEDEELEFEDLDEEDDEAEEAPVKNHLMIEARTPEKGLQMAVDALKQIHRENGVKNPVAKIRGSRLSARGVLASADKLTGKDLVVEEAGDLTPQALKELNELMDQDASGMIVVLIDNPKQMEKLHREHPILASKFECIGSGEEQPLEEPMPRREEREAEKAFSPAPPKPERPVEAEKPLEAQGSYDMPYQETFREYPEDSWLDEGSAESGSYEADDFYEEEEGNTSSVRDEAGPGYNGEEMDIDEFAQYACRYANEIDCSITGKSMLALYERIEIMEEDGIALTRANAEELIEEAADRAEKPSFGKRLKGLFSSKYDKDGLLILKEEHFIY